MGPLQGIQDVADETCLNRKKGDVLFNFSLRWNHFFLQLQFYNLIFQMLKLVSGFVHQGETTHRVSHNQALSQDKHVFVYLLGWILS